MSKADEIEKLKKLQEEGAITKKEFDTEKKKILSTDVVVQETPKTTSTSSKFNLEGLFQGRISRTNFLVGFLINFGINFGLGIFAELPFMWLIILPAFFIFILYGVSFWIRRLHDLNLTGWLTLLVLVPFVNFIFFLYALLAPPVEEGNQYGEYPDRKVDIAKLYGFN